MTLLGRLRCWLTGEHDWQWVENYGPVDGEVEWCPRCTAIRDVR